METKIFCIGIWFNISTFNYTSCNSNYCSNNIAQDMTEPDPSVDFDAEAVIEELEIQQVQFYNDIDVNERRSLIDTYFAR